MKLMMIDLDGTLFDTKEINYRAYKEAIEPYVMESIIQIFCHKLQPMMRRFYLRCISGKRKHTASIFPLEK